MKLIKSLLKVSAAVVLLTALTALAGCDRDYHRRFAYHGGRNYAFYEGGHRRYEAKWTHRRGDDRHDGRRRRHWDHD